MIYRIGMALLVGVVSLTPAWGASITVVNADGSGEGLNDGTVVAPVGGNSGTTLGEQRLIAFQYAADIWGAILTSSVAITVEANFDELSCDASGAVLGSAGPTTVHRDFAGAPEPDTWYTQALANSLAGVDLAPTDPDVFANFNSAIGTTCAFPGDWYYGLDGSPPGGQFDFATVALHEIGHGLGFLSLVGLGSGSKFLGSDDAYMVHLQDHSTGLHFPEMTNAERRAAHVDEGDLFWTGLAVGTAGSILVDGRDPITGDVEIYAPTTLNPGSSVSHFSTTLAPDELMEPFYTGPNHDPGLALGLMIDLGWNCGDGIVDPGEDCDDGNHANGDGCSTACMVEECHACSAGNPSICIGQTGNPCDDGQACTFNDMCVAGTCQADATPRTGCLTGTQSGKGIILMKDKANDASDKLVWKWIKGEQTNLADFAMPTAGDEYLLCVYDNSGGEPTVLMSMAIPGGADWKGKPSGFKYKNKLTAPDGVKVVVLKPGDSGKAKIIVKGKGELLPMTNLALLDFPLTVQLGNDSVCWEGTYGNNISKNLPDFFKAKLD